MNLQRNRAGLVAAIIAALASSTASATTPTAGMVEAAIPDLEVRNISPVAAVPGLFEVIDSGGHVIYVDQRVSVALEGELFDVATHRSLTQESVSRLNAIDFKSLPFDLAIRQVRGNGRRQLAVFADPDCPYCAQLERTLQTLDDVTVFVFLYPLDELHPEASSRATDIWCAPDRDAAWRGWLLARKQPPKAAAGCNPPLAKLAEIAAAHQFRGTPSVIFPSGRTAFGALPAQDITRMLEEPVLTPAADRASSKDR